MVVIVVCIVAAIAGAWMLVIQPKRSQASKLGDQVKAAQAQLSAAQQQVAQGEAARNAYATSYASLARLGEAVPADDNVPSLIFQVQGAASASKVDFQTLSLSSSGGSSSTVTTSSATQAAAVALPPGASMGPAGFPIEPFTFTFNGNFFHLSNFLGRLERFVVAKNNQISVSGRLMTLDAISLGAGPAGFPQITATVSATTFLVPAAQGLMNGATTTGPAGAAGTPVSSGSSSSVSSAPAAISSPVK
jgi:type II secretory pathway pseudopilin PulG